MPSEPTILWADASHYRLAGGGATRGVAGIAVANPDGSVVASATIWCRTATGAELEAVWLAVRAVRQMRLPEPVEIRTDCESVARQFRQARKPWWRVVLASRDGNTAHDEAQRMAVAGLRRALRLGFSAPDALQA
jgi:ribonuclease HI